MPERIGFADPVNMSLAVGLSVSVIIPVLNEAGVIRESIARAWQAGADEVLVADGGSTDDTLKIVGESKCRLVSSPAGRAVQQNAAARIATSDVLLFLHADTWLPEGAIAQVRAACQNRAVTYGAFRQHIEADGLLYRWLERGNAARIRWLGLPYGDQGTFVRRETFAQVGGFPETRLMEDLLLMRRLRKQSWPTLLPGPLFVSARRWQKHGVLRQTARNWLLLAGERLGVSPDQLARWYV